MHHERDVQALQQRDARVIRAGAVHDYAINRGLGGQLAVGALTQEETMKNLSLASAASMALTASLAQAEQLTVFGPWLGPDQENVEAVLAAFAEASGHDVRYVGSDSFEQQILVDAEAGSAANVSVFPQPGLAADMASRGFLTPLADGTADWVRANYAAGQSRVDLGTYAGADDLRGIGQRPPYIARLGVDAIWVSPFLTSPMADFGYDISDFRDVDPVFGTLADFDAVVETAYGLGLQGVFQPRYAAPQNPLGLVRCR